MDINEIVGLRIKEIRKEKGISQLELANKIGVSQAYVNYIENGKRSIDLKMLEKIANALNVDIGDLLNLKLSYRVELNEDSLLNELINLKFPKKKKKIKNIAKLLLKQTLRNLEDLSGLV